MNISVPRPRGGLADRIERTVQDMLVVCNLIAEYSERIHLILKHIDAPGERTSFMTRYSDVYALKQQRVQSVKNLAGLGDLLMMQAGELLPRQIREKCLVLLAISSYIDRAHKYYVSDPQKLSAASRLQSSEVEQHFQGYMEDPLSLDDECR